MRPAGLVVGLVLVVTSACTSQPPEITSAGTVRVEVDPDAPSTTTTLPKRTAATNTAPARTTVPEATVASTARTTTTPPNTTAAPPTTRPPRTTAPPTTPKQRVDLLCDSFLLSQGNVYESVYLGAMEDVRRALRPGASDRVKDAVDTLIVEDRLETGRSNRLTAILEEEVVGECRSRYFAGVEPQEDVVSRFFNLVVAGRREAAKEMAPAHVIARFEPWEPWPSTELISPGIRIRSDTSFVMALSETVEAVCTHFGGTIRSCHLSRTS